MLITQINPHISNYIAGRMGAGLSTFALCGGRRSGKTFCIMQFLILRVMDGDIVNVASMTQEQGRLGAFADMQTIIGGSGWMADYFDILSSPRELRSRFNDGKIVFNSYQNPETAKGIACDWLFVNEANNFSKQQFTDLMANVRKGVFIDYNPNSIFWVDDFFTPDDICHSTWQDNPYLSPLQIKYFENLKAQAEKPDASALDIKNYNIYYLGIFSELRGKVFTPNNFNFIDTLPPDLKNFTIFCDPSALRGADWFACVLSAKDKDENVYIIDTFSINTGTREMILHHLQNWCASYDRVRILVESNGAVGLDFIRYCRENELGVDGYCNRDNKVERILANYHNFKDYTYIVRHPLMESFMAQVYDFDVQCEHDDNVDALSSSYDYHRKMYWH